MITYRISLLFLLLACGSTGLDSDYEVRTLTYEQRMEFKEDLEMARLFLEAYGVRGTEQPFEAKNLDLAFTNWIEDKSNNNKENPNRVIDYLGVAFGQCLIDKMDFQWKLLSDSYGEDFMVIHPKYEITSFPFSTVYKMIDEPNEERTFQAVELYLEDLIKEANQSGEIEERAR